MDCLLTMAEVEWDHEAYFRSRVERSALGRRYLWRPLPPRAAGSAAAEALASSPATPIRGGRPGGQASRPRSSLRRPGSSLDILQGGLVGRRGGRGSVAPGGPGSDRDRDGARGLPARLGERPAGRARHPQLRGGREARPRAQLLRLPQLGAQERRPEPPGVRDRGGRAEGRPHLVEGRPEGPHARHARAAVPAALGRRGRPRHRLDRGRLRARRGGGTTRPRPRHRAPAQPHRVRQLRARPARRRPAPGRGLPAGRHRLRLRQQRRRALALAGALREVSDRGRPHRARGDLRPRGEGAGPRARVVHAGARRADAGGAPGVRQERPHAPQRGARQAPLPGHRDIRHSPDPRRRAARGLRAARGRVVPRRPAGRSRADGSRGSRLVLDRPPGLLGQDARVPPARDGGGASALGHDREPLRRPAAVLRRPQSFEAAGPAAARVQAAVRTRRPRRSRSGASSSRSGRRSGRRPTTRA